MTNMNIINWRQGNKTVVNVKDFGAKGDNSTDDTAAIQKAFDFAYNAGGALYLPFQILFPEGIYRVSSQVGLGRKNSSDVPLTPNSTGTINLDIIGEGGATLRYTGNDTNSITGCVLAINGAKICTIKHMAVDCIEGATAYSGIRIGGGGGSGQHYLEDVIVRGSGTSNVADIDFTYGVYFAAPDGNNDFNQLTQCRIDYTDVAVWIETSQSKSNYFNNCFLDANKACIECAGSFYWSGGAMGGAQTCVLLTTSSGLEPIFIDGCNCEGAQRFLCSPRTGYTDKYDPMAGTNNDQTNSIPNLIGSNNNAQAVHIRNVRWAGEWGPIDGLENLDGVPSYTGGSYSPGLHTASAPTANELDGAHGTVGWTAPIIYLRPGPLTVENCHFYPIAPTSVSGDDVARRMKIIHLGSTAGTSTIVRSCMFHGDDHRINPIVHSRATFGDLTHIEATDNVMTLEWTSSILTADWAVKGLTLGVPQQMPDIKQSRPAGLRYRSWTALGATSVNLAAVSKSNIYHIGLGAGNTTSITMPPVETAGEILTLVFDLFQPSASFTYTVAPTAWPVDAVLTGGTFHLRPVYLSKASITFMGVVNDILGTGSITRQWVEIGRSGTYTGGTTTPTSTFHTWAVGDIFWHTDPGIGDPIGWVCTTAGAYGGTVVWAPFGYTNDVGHGVISYTFAYGDFTSSTTTYKDSTNTIPTGARILGTRVVVTAAFNGTTPTCSLYVDGTADTTLQATTDNDLTSIAQYKSDELITVAANGTGKVRAALTCGGTAPTQGAAEVFVEYVVTPRT